MKESEARLEILKILSGLKYPDHSIISLINDAKVLFNFYKNGAEPFIERGHN